MSTTTILSRDGDILAAGLQSSDVCDHALQVARRLAAEAGEEVLLIDADGEWKVRPNGTLELMTHGGWIELGLEPPLP